MEHFNSKLGLEEYRIHVLDNISGVVVNPNYIEENLSFFNKIVFKMFQDYDNSIVEISINKQIKMLNMFLSVMLLEKPSLELSEDIITLN